MKMQLECSLQGLQSLKRQMLSPMKVNAFLFLSVSWLFLFFMGIDTPLTAVVMAEYPIPTESSSPDGICSGPDGNIWFTESLRNKIGVKTLDGVVIHEYPIPSLLNSIPVGIAVGADGNEFSLLLPNRKPFGITSGPDGNMWFTVQSTDKIGKITPSGTLTFYPLVPGSEPTGMLSVQMATSGL